MTTIDFPHTARETHTNMTTKRSASMCATSAALGFAALLFLSVTIPGPARAHCDTLDGPVVTDARAALESGEIAPILKWIHPQDEPEIREAFVKTVQVRRRGDDARDLADNYFFETLVRVHRAGEGASYTGLKPAGSHVDPGITAADHALEAGSIEPVLKDLEEQLGSGIEQRFARVIAAAAHKDHNAEAGREYVEAYVEFIHYVERLHNDLASATPRKVAEEEAAAHGACGKHAD